MAAALRGRPGKTGVTTGEVYLHCEKTGDKVRPTIGKGKKFAGFPSDRGSQERRRQTRTLRRNPNAISARERECDNRRCIR